MNKYSKERVTYFYTRQVFLGRLENANQSYFKVYSKCIVRCLKMKAIYFFGVVFGCPLEFLYFVWFFFRSMNSYYQAKKLKSLLEHLYSVIPRITWKIIRFLLFFWSMIDDPFIFIILLKFSLKNIKNLVVMFILVV